MAAVSLSAIVLRRRDLGETDRIVTLLTRERGKLDAVAKGARRHGSKSAGASEPFTEARIQFAEGRSLGIVTQWSVVNSFGEIRSDLGLLARASYMCELTDRLVDDHEPCGDVFDLITGGLALMRLGLCAPDTVVHAFEMRLLMQRGYAPSLDSCVRCSAGVSPATDDSKGRYAISPALGGVTCASCCRRDAGATTGAGVSPAAVEALQTLASAELSVLGEMVWSRAVAGEVAAALRAFIRYHCDREIKSAGFLAMVRAGEA